MEFLRLLESIRTPFFDGLMGILTYLGEQTVFMVAVMTLLWCVNKKWGYRLCFIGMLGNLINQFLKAIFTIPRPWVIDPDFTIVESAREAATGYSFPSGHTQSATAVLATFAVYFKKRWVTIVCAVLIIVAAFSRMYLGVHTPLDVGVSLATGLITVFAGNVLLDAAEKRKNGLFWFGIGEAVLTIALLAYVLLAPKTAANVEQFDNDGIKAAVTSLGAMLAMLIAFLVDEKHTHYTIEGAWWAQILKVIVGLGIIVGIRMGLKPLFTAIFGESYFADGVRYFVMVFFGGVIYPLTFKWWARLGTKKKADSAQ